MAKAVEDIHDYRTPLVAPPPGIATATLRAPKNRYFLGEPFRVEFVLRNSGTDSFIFSFGGDYRGANRALRYRVQALDDTGKPVPEALSPRTFFGGVTSREAIQPGESWSEKLWPLDYLQITRPGAYTLRITHDFGWNTPDDERARHVSLRSAAAAFPGDRPGWKSPVAEMRVEFVVADDRQLDAMLDDIAAAIQAKDRERIPSPEDLAHPEYLAALEKRATSEDMFFLNALGLVPGKKATAALLGLAQSGGNVRSDTSRLAAALLERRMPLVKFERDNPPWADPVREQLTASSWDDSFAPAARELASRYLKQFDPAAAPSRRPGGIQATGYFRGYLGIADFPEVCIGANILKRTGTADDYPVLRNTLREALNLTLSPRRGDATILDYPDPIPDLIRALDSLRERGFVADEDPSGDEGFFLYFHWLADAPVPRPERWKDTLDTFGASNRYPVWQAALESIPAPMPADCRDFVLRSLEARDYGVIMHACQVAGASGDKTLLRSVLDVIATETCEWLLRAAANAAWTLGARTERAAALAERIPDALVGNTAFEALRRSVLDGDGASDIRLLPRRQRIELRDMWRTWIAAHASDLEASRKFKPEDIPATPAPAPASRQS